MLFDFVDEWISVWTSGFEKSLVHLTSGSESLAKPLRRVIPNDWLKVITPSIGTVDLFLMIN